MNILDSLKKIFFKNGSSEASSDARIPLLTATGEPKGSDTMANIASVLGGIPSPKQMQVLDNNDINTILGDERGTVSQTYRCSSDCLNLPISGSDGYMTVFRWSAQLYSTQIFYNQNFNRTFIRSNRHSDTIDWSSWEEYSLNIPDFYKSYGDLGSLASALGVDTNKIENVDIDNLATTAVYWFDSENITTVIHFPFNWGLLNVYSVNGATYQIADNMRGNRKCRNYNMQQVGWSEWIDL